MPSASQENHSNKARNRDLVKLEGVHLFSGHWQCWSGMSICDTVKPDVWASYTCTQLTDVVADRAHGRVVFAQILLRVFNLELSSLYKRSRFYFVLLVIN